MLVLYLKDLNVVIPDKWDTCQLVAFLEQVKFVNSSTVQAFNMNVIFKIANYEPNKIINYKGCYDHNGDWIIMQHIQLVCSLNLDRSQGRFEFSSRFISLVRVASVRQALMFTQHKINSHSITDNLTATETVCHLLPSLERLLSVT